MKKMMIAMITIAGLLLYPVFEAKAEDMRMANLEAQKQKAALLEKARNEKIQAQKEAQENRGQILADRQKLLVAVRQLKQRNALLGESNRGLQEDVQRLTEQEEKLSARFAEMDAAARELLGLIRVHVKEIHALIRQSPQSAMTSGRSAMPQALINQSRFPGMDNLRQMVDLLFDEMQRSGEVQLQRGRIVDRSGEESEADILRLGNFTAAYRLGSETGFLLYSDTSERFFALSQLPGHRQRKELEQYMRGQSESVPVDISRGGALRQLTHRTSLWQRIRNGGPIVWPILAVGLLAVMIILERSSYLLRMQSDADGLMRKIGRLASRADWEKCAHICQSDNKKPVPKVLAAGIEFRNACRADMENVLQEAVLREIPKLERFLSTLGMLAAIAPLLGLLGTVTGMINTFHAITCFGTGDPRTMSGGISEALVTTMLGLGVAIPVMLCHTVLTRMIDNLVGQMEEKAVAFTNLIFKERDA